MLRPASIDMINRNSSYQSLGSEDVENETSNYSDENDTTNLSKLYHYETSEDVGDENESDEPNCCPELNRALVIYKTFYFLFFGAVGALFPYLAVFYKQLWLSPHQVGILIGLRPFIQMCASPLWGILADTYNASKWMLLMSIGAWLVSNYSISFVKPKQYEPNCSLNLTYLPLTDDVDDQDFNWVRIEPLVSKKDNISKPASFAGIDNNNNNDHDGVHGYDNKDYTEDLTMGENFGDDKIYNDGKDDGYDDDDDARKDGIEHSRTAERSKVSSLFSKYKNGQKDMVEKKNVSWLINKPGEGLANGKYVMQNNTSKNTKFMKILRTMYRINARGLDKTKLKIIKNAGIVKRDDQSMKRNDANKQRISSRLWKEKNLSMPTQDPENQFQSNVTSYANTTKDQRVTFESKRNYSQSRNLSRTDRKTSENLLNDDQGKPDYVHIERVRNVANEEQINEDLQENEDKYNNEETEEYLQDAMSDEKGEFFTESILPNQRVLAKEGLKEEFDSLKSPGRLFWPIDSRSDVTNSSDPENREETAETKQIFRILLVITICGTILSSPAATLADTATLQALGDNKYRYGQQRLWGAFGWGLGAFIVGAVVSLIQEIQPCADPKHIDYILSFYVYAGVMVLAFICAIFFKFEPISDISYKESFWEAVKLFVDCQHVCFIITLLCSGTAMGFTHTFLFWHLHDMGGSQFLFSIIAAVQCISEVFMYFVSGYLILKIGCDSVLYIGLLANVLRLFAYSVITQPFYSIPLEVLQGISSASIWTAAICYVGLNEGVQVTLQAMLHGIYWGLGHGGGGMLGGLVFGYLGSNATFIIFGICCIINLVVLLIMKYWKKLFEFVGGYTSVETIPTGTYILVERQMVANKH